jgi:hypothetical protein
MASISGQLQGALGCCEDIFAVAFCDHSAVTHDAVAHRTNHRYI